MALHANTIWEIRPTNGSANNGGGFVPCYYVSSAVVATGGTGYSVNDVLTLSGANAGTSLGVIATFKVETIGADPFPVATVSVVETGGYPINQTSTLPVNPVGTTVAPAVGTGCTLTLILTAATDYSQQNAAQTDPTDLVIDGTTNTMISSAAQHPFTAAMVGNIINVTAGTGFTVQWAQIFSFNNSTTQATLDKSAGTLSSTGGTGYLGGATETINTIFNIIVAGNTVYLAKTSGETAEYDGISAARTLTTGTINESAPGVGGPINIIGYTNTSSGIGTGTEARNYLTSQNWNDSHTAAGFLTTTGYPTISLGANLLTLGAVTNLSCVIVNSTRAGSSLISSAGYSFLWRVKVTNSNAGGAGIAFSGGSRNTCIDCEFINDGASSSRSLTMGGGSAGASIAHACRITSVGGDGVLMTNSSILSSCLIYDVLTAGKSAVVQTVADGSNTLLNCTIDNCTTAVSQGASGTTVTLPNLTLINCTVTNCGTGITNLNSANQVIPLVSFHNRLRDNNTSVNYVGWRSQPVSGSYGIGDITTDSNDATEYVDATTNDYHLKSTSLAKAAGVPPYTDIGAWQRGEPYPVDAKHVRKSVVIDKGNEGLICSTTTATGEFDTNVFTCPGAFVSAQVGMYANLISGDWIGYDLFAGRYLITACDDNSITVSGTPMITDTTNVVITIGGSGETTTGTMEPDTGWMKILPTGDVSRIQT